MAATILLGLFFITGCSNSSLSEKQKDTGYTSESAIAIEVGLTRVSFAIIVAAVIRGIMNK